MAKRQDRTEADTERALTVEQGMAMAELLTGSTDQEAAEQAGVTRQTVNGWANHDPLFVAEMNARREALWGAHVDKLRALVGQAVDVLAGDLQSEDLAARRSAAVHVLRAVGLYGQDARPYGETTAVAVAGQWQREAITEATTGGMFGNG